MVAPTSEEARVAPTIPGPKAENSHADSLTTAAERKTFATLKAQLAIRGYTIHTVSDGYVVSRWNLTKYVPDLRSLDGFARQIGVRQ